jgi:hypothetical protein
MYKAYDLIKKLESRIGEEEAKELIEFIESSKGDIATKSDLQLLRTDLQLLRTELESKIEKSKVDILKWQFGFWVTIIGAIVAIWLSK